MRKMINKTIKCTPEVVCVEIHTKNTNFEDFISKNFRNSR